MGRVYLCLGKNAEVPYYFERARVHVWNIEELCYFIRENVWLLEPALFGKELTAWVDVQCGLPELAGMLADAARKETGVMEFVRTLFGYTGYCSAEEAEQVEKVLKLNAGSSALEKMKARGDFFLEGRRYVLALYEYGELLKSFQGTDPAFLGKVYHNQGVAAAQLFWFEQAAASFEQAWKLTRKPAYARQYLAAKRLAQPEQEYVAFLAECPDLYEASLALEERMQQCEEEWQQSEGAKFISHATEAMQDGAAHICRQMLTERFGPLKEQYKGFVAR